jgi:hypothetical protein
MEPPAKRAPAPTLLWRIKLIHTAFWALFAGAIVAIPIATLLGALQWAL